MNPTYLFESARVDISSKGKIRARTVNYIQPSKVDLVSLNFYIFLGFIKLYIYFFLILLFLKIF